MKRIAILGLGLMGGSLGLALKTRGPACHVAGYTRTPARGRLARRRGAVDSLHDDPAAAVAGADLVVYAAPIMRIPELVRASRAGLKVGAVLTDVGSTKSYLDAEVPRLLAGSGALFVGSHPIAGSEQQGIEAARPDLYEGAVVVVTPAAGSPAAAVRSIKGLWKKVGGVVVDMDGREHDRIMARTSHLPHLVASLLAATVGRAGGVRDVGTFCGAGFADTSRVAEGAPEVWHDIVRTNRANLAEELRAYKLQLEKLVSQLDEGDFDGVQAVLERGRAARRALLQRGRKGRT